jgi:hypothetical protein
LILPTVSLSPIEGPRRARIGVTDATGGADAAGLWVAGGRKESRSSVSSSICVMTDKGTVKVTTMPPVPLRSSSSKTASVTCTLPAFEAILPFKLSCVSLSAGTDETSIPSHDRVSRSLGPPRLKSPDTVGRA